MTKNKELNGASKGAPFQNTCRNRLFQQPLKVRPSVQIRNRQRLRKPHFNVEASLLHLIQDVRRRFNQCGFAGMVSEVVDSPELHWIVLRQVQLQTEEHTSELQS